jgi:hypothetical protein
MLLEVARIILPLEFRSTTKDEGVLVLGFSDYGLVKPL